MSYEKELEAHLVRTIRQLDEESEFGKAQAHRSSSTFKSIVKKHKLKPWYEMGDTKTSDHLVHNSQKDAVTADLKAANIPHSLSGIGNGIYGNRLTIKGS